MTPQSDNYDYYRKRVLEISGVDVEKEWEHPDRRGAVVPGSGTKGTPKRMAHQVSIRIEPEEMDILKRYADKHNDELERPRTIGRIIHHILANADL